MEAFLFADATAVANMTGNRTFCDVQFYRCYNLQMMTILPRYIVDVINSAPTYF